MTGLTSGQSRVGAAEGCDLLILFFKIQIRGSQPAAAPTGGNRGRKKTGQSLGRFFLLQI
ncbi:hypothetical protein [Pseudomonas sp. TSRC2-2]|uniref:hypothetical protein n=1 Tax=unclassified Pseudomonas TaxID=196821 RepID=UPI003CED9A78